jgi:hypothetical protein
VTIPPIDRGQADQFLSLLGKDPETARLRAFPHRLNPNRYDEETNPDGIRARKGRYSLTTASQWQREGRGVYLVINDGGDVDADITSCRAFWVEWDTRPLGWQLQAWQEFGLGEPSFIVTTGGKSAHLYWALSEPITVVRWRPIQLALIAATGADPVNKNPSRVMRLPGAFYLGPDGKASGQSQIHSSSDRRYSVEEVETWLPEQPGAAAAESDHADPFAGIPLSDASDLPPRPLEEIREALACIPSRPGAGSGTYGFYRRILWGLIRACKEAGHSKEAAIELMQAHSPEGWDIRQVAGYDFSQVRSNSLWGIAREHGWRPRGKHSGGAQQGQQPPGKPSAPSADAGAADGHQDLPRDELIQQQLDQLLDLHLDPTDPWAKQQATRAELWNLGVRGDAIDDRLLYALADRWELPLKAGHAGARRGRSITDPLDSPAEDLLPGFLLWRRDHLLFGAGGAGKTLAAAAMGVAIIKGTAFLDQEIAPDRTGRVLWIGSDGGEGARAMVAEYLEDLGAADDPDVIDGFTIWTAEGSDKIPAWSCSPRGLLELKEELEVGSYALVVIDSLKAVLELAGINFGIGPVGTLMRFMQALVGRHCSLLWLHHPAGGKAAGKGLQAAAGSQNINQIPSAVHQLTRAVSERGPVNEWSVHKLRGSQSREFSYRLSEDGFEVTKGEITGNARAAILDCIELRNQAGVPAQTHLIITEMFGTSESTIRNNLTWLRKRGLVGKAGTAWRLTDKGRKALALIGQGVAKPWV